MHQTSSCPNHCEMLEHELTVKLSKAIKRHVMIDRWGRLSINYNLNTRTLLKFPHILHFTARLKLRKLPYSSIAQSTNS